MPRKGSNHVKYWLKSKYGMTLEDFDRMMEDQDGKCAICGATEPGPGRSRFSVDHCHETGEVRGLLCQSCNLGLGHFKDSRERLLAAVQYLGWDTLT